MLAPQPNLISKIFPWGEFMVMHGYMPLNMYDLNRALNRGELPKLSVSNVTRGTNGFYFDRVYVLITDEFLIVRDSRCRLVAFHRTASRLINFDRGLSGRDQDLAHKFLLRVATSLRATPSQNHPPVPQAAIPVPYTPAPLQPTPPPAAPQPTPPAAPQAAYGGYQNPYTDYQQQPYNGFQNPRDATDPRQAVNGGDGHYQDDDNSVTMYNPHRRRNDTPNSYCNLTCIAVVLLVVFVCCTMVGYFMLNFAIVGYSGETRKLAENHGKRIWDIETVNKQNTEFIAQNLRKSDTKLTSLAEQYEELSVVVEENKKESNTKHDHSDRQHARAAERMQYMEKGLQYLYRSTRSDHRGAPAIEDHAHNDKFALETYSAAVVQPAFGMDKIFTYTGYAVVLLITFVWAVNMINFCLNGRN